MTYAWADAILEVDLSRGKTERSRLGLESYQGFIGGKGINIKLFWDRVPPEVEPFSPDNLLIFTAGALNGTAAPSANRTTISYKSPLSKLFSSSSLGGFWAPELKHAGYDSVVVSGKSPRPVYLWINDDHVELRDASRLWGKDILETQRLIREELKNERVQVLCIGVAGENRNTAASIQHGIVNCAGRSGAGAVMGDKNLKAVAVYGTKDVSVARPAELIQLRDSVLERSGPQRDWWRKYHVTGGFSQAFVDWGVFGNVHRMPEGVGFENMEAAHADFAGRHLVREPACYNCPFKCHALLSVPDVGVVGVKCTGWWSFMLACKIPDIAFSLKCYDRCVKYGLDHLSTANRVAFAIDLYQNGILTKEDTDGLHLEYGNRELALVLVEKMARREGIGDVLADGVYEAARRIGRGAERYTSHIKKLEIKFHTYYNTYLAFTTAISDRADTPCAGSAQMSPVGMRWDMEPHQYIKEGWWLFPEEWERYLYLDHAVDYEGIAEVAAYGEDVKTLSDLTGICWNAAGFVPFVAIKPNTHVRLLSAATGMDIDQAEAFKLARKTRALIQAYNSRLGLRRRDDTVPEKFFQKEVVGYQKEKGLVRLDHGKFDEQLDRYYRLKGWSRDAIPTGEALDGLGLGYVRHDLEDRGIL
ncbi:MAG: hypothetical protein HY530_01650 [Chloroflexi bacterium]|nr:hypothetical protein [Chloroflexota bacterium]